MASLDGMTRAELIKLVEDMRDDWRMMNDFINTTATAFGWCDEYEERIYKYNDLFKVMRVEGRVPEGKRVSVRNAFAARRLAMGQVLSTLSEHGLDLPEGALCGVVRDHKALSVAQDKLARRLQLGAQREAEQ